MTIFRDGLDRQDLAVSGTEDRIVGVVQTQSSIPQILRISASARQVLLGARVAPKQRTQNRARLIFGISYFGLSNSPLPLWIFGCHDILELDLPHDIALWAWFCKPRQRLSKREVLVFSGTSAASHLLAGSGLPSQVGAYGLQTLVVGMSFGLGCFRIQAAVAAFRVVLFEAL